jgi:hypothetical protein
MVQPVQHVPQRHDLSAAVDPDMAIQIYFGGQPTSAIHEESWTRMRYGWKATGLRAR